MDIRKQKDCIQVTSKFKSGSELEVLFVSDVHLDSKLCDRQLFKKHLEYIKQKNGLVCIIGDLLDVMQGRNDRRGNKSSLKSDLKTSSYFNEVIKDAYKFLEPYKDNILIISEGNHEGKVKDIHEFDLLDILGSMLGCNIGGYDGWLKFLFKMHKGGRSKSFDCYYNHGGGGNSPVTLGVIGTNRRQVMVNADLFVSGHDHNSWEVNKTVRYLSQQGSEKVKEVTHLNLSTYKTLGKWEKEKGFPAPTLGGVFVKFYYEQDEVKFNYTRAK